MPPILCDTPERIAITMLFSNHLPQNVFGQHANNRSAQDL
jgi:hypothetical protein